MWNSENVSWSSNKRDPDSGIKKISFEQQPKKFLFHSKRFQPKFPWTLEDSDQNQNLIKKKILRSMKSIKNVPKVFLKIIKMKKSQFFHSSSAYNPFFRNPCLKNWKDWLQAKIFQCLQRKKSVQRSWYQLTLHASLMVGHYTTGKITALRLIVNKVYQQNLQRQELASIHCLRLIGSRNLQLDVFFKFK